MLDKINLSRGCWLILKTVKDSRGGVLTIAEAGAQIPFIPCRSYTISDLGPECLPRGYHAHQACRQAIFCLSGSFTLDLDDGQSKQSAFLNSPENGILIEPLLWHVMRDFSPNCIILVLADSSYDESDYLRSYDEFLKAQHDSV